MSGDHFRGPIEDAPLTGWERFVEHAAKGILTGAGLLGLASVILLLIDEAIRLWTMGR